MPLSSPIFFFFLPESLCNSCLNSIDVVSVACGFLMDLFAGTWGSGLTFFNTLGEVRKESENPLSWVFLGFLMKFSDAVN